MTNKGIYYEPGKEPPLEGPPKLHLLIESNEEYRVRIVPPIHTLQLLTVILTGRTSSQRNQEATHRGIGCCFTGRNASSNSNRQIQCCLGPVVIVILFLMQCVFTPCCWHHLYLLYCVAVALVRAPPSVNMWRTARVIIHCPLLHQ